jgi:small-conductance mechanosensitive channel
MNFLNVILEQWDKLVQGFVGQNTFQDYFMFLGVFVGLFLLLIVIDKFTIKILEKTKKKKKKSINDYIIGFMNNIGWIFYAYVSLFVAAHILTLSNLINNVLGFILILVIGYYIGRGINGIVDKLVGQKIKEKYEKANLENVSMIKVLGVFAKIGVWVLILLMVLTNLGIEITPLIAGLGVGGIAIALALQSVLGDLFSAFVIYFDKPFKEGDFIIIGNDMGTVKEIGIKTTRIQALQGHELVVANSELTSVRINNYKKMEKRRVPFSFGVTYDTPAVKLKKIKKIVEEIIKNSNTEFKKQKKNETIDLDRVNFKAFGNSSLDFEVVYYVPSNDYNEYMNIQEYINLSLVKEFKKEKIKFAYPTRTIYIEK